MNKNQVIYPSESKGQNALSALEEDILSAVFNKERYGLEIIDSVYCASNNQRKIGPNSLYPTLRRMEKKGYISSRWGDERPEELAVRNGARRRYYKATDEGKQLLSSIFEYRRKLTELSEDAQLQPAYSL